MDPETFEEMLAAILEIIQECASAHDGGDVEVNRGPKAWIGLIVDGTKSNFASFRPRPAFRLEIRIPKTDSRDTELVKHGMRTKYQDGKYRLNLVSLEQIEKHRTFLQSLLCLAYRLRPNQG